jgi:putative hydrolase of the HAD superfamily
MPGRNADPVWLFDLDNTLHDATPHIFPRINRAMTAYIMRELSVDEPEANRLRQAYWSRYGATLRGLVAHHGIDPDHFLWHTHQFPDLDAILIHDRTLRHVLPRLPGRKVLFSNAPRHYAEAVLARIGIGRCFDTVYAIEHLRLRPKPEVSAYVRLLSDLRVPASRCIMVEDSEDNLKTAKRLGIRTVWVSACTRRPPCVDIKVRHIGELYRRFSRR